LGGSIFSGNSNITAVSIPNSVYLIGDEAFKDCTSITSLNIPSNASSIGLSAFSGCSRLTNLSVPPSLQSYVAQYSDLLGLPAQAQSPYYVAVKNLQSLSFPAIPPTTYSPNKKITLTATASSRLKSISYSSANTSVATISNNILTVVGSGNSLITAIQQGDNITAPVSASQNLTVNPVVQTISFPAIPAQTLSKTKVMTLAATSSAKFPITYIVANTAIATNMSSNSLTLLGTGSTTVTATNAGSQNYTPASATQTLIVK
jgi:hypothetical protein